MTLRMALGLTLLLTTVTVSHAQDNQPPDGFRACSTART